MKKEDPFFIKTYALEEAEQGSLREVPNYYFATRFAGKEAVFKCLGIGSDGIKLNEIIILDDENGQPKVTLTGNLLLVAKEKGIDHILISLSYTEESVIAFAVAQTA